MKKTYILIACAILLVLIFLLNNKQANTDVVRVGVIATLSGNTAYYGESTKRGVEVAVEQFKKIYPKNNIEVFYEDSRFDPKIGIEAYNKLRSFDNVDAVIVQGSNIAVALAPLAIRDNVLLFGASALASGYTSPDDLTFRLSPRAMYELDPFLNYVKERNIKKVSLLYMKNEIGQSLADSLKEEIKKQKLPVEIVTDDSFPVETTDFKTLLTKTKQGGAPVVYVAALASHTASILNQARALDINAQFFGFRATEDPILLKNASASAEGLLYSNAYDPGDSGKEQSIFSNAYSEKFGEMPNGFAAEAYESFRFVADVYHSCVKQDYACIKSHLFAVQGVPSVFGPLSFDKNGDVTYPFFVKTVRDGEFVRLK